MKWSVGVSAALGSAFLFGISTPLTKLLLHDINPWLLAGLLYLGSGIGLLLYRQLMRMKPVTLPLVEVRWFAGAILMGGIIAPVLLMFGLVNLPAANAALLLNAESVFTALLAWFVFHENVDRRIALGMIAIVAGAMILSVAETPQSQSGYLLPTLAILAACFAWGVDNNLTRKVSLTDATWITSAKGLVAGTTNLVLAWLIGASLPAWKFIGGAMIVGFFAYGISLTLFVLGLRHLGTARSGAYFAVAPFFGAVFAVLVLHEAVTPTLLIAGGLMAWGVWLHVTEDHNHTHEHAYLAHEHEHNHYDGHHDHDHNPPVATDTKHAHWHEHPILQHSHSHFPDAHHQHSHH